MAEPGPTAAAQAVRDALRRADGAGRLRSRDMPELRPAVDALRNGGVRLDHPAELFGAWSDLPASVRDALRAAAGGEIARAMTWFPHGRVWPGLARTLRQVRARPIGLDADAMDLWAARVWRTPWRLREAVHVAACRRAFAREAAPDAEALLAAVGRPPSWLLGDFAEGVEIHPLARGYFHDAGTGSTWGYLTGIDLIPTPDGVVCIEANLNTAFNDERRAQMCPEPSIRAALDLAVAVGARGLCWRDMDLSPTPDWVLEELGEGARAAGLALSVLEDVRVRRGRPVPPGLPVPREGLASPVDPPPRTLVVRRNELGVGSDPMLSDKGLFTRAVAAELERAGDRRVRIPGMTRAPVVHPPDAPGLPNLVYKYPDRGKGQGVFFFNARDAEHARSLARRIDREQGEAPGLFQEFRCSRLLPGRRIYDARAELLVTPLGVVHCFTIRRESMRALPETIGEGVLDVRGAFTSNLATGGRFAPIDPAEADELRQAALAVGEALARAFGRTFVTTRPKEGP